MESNLKTDTKSEIGLGSDLLVSKKSLPMVIETQSQNVSLLVDRRKFSDEQNAQVMNFVEVFDMDNTADILSFASAPQRQISGHLDALLEGVRTDQAGAAGDLAMALADGINLMQLDKVRGMLKGEGTGWFSRLMMALGIFTNYIKAFKEAKDPITDKFKEMETTAKNQQVNVRSEINKLDRLVNASVEQIGLLELYIIAGEDILAKAVERYRREAQEALDSQDGLRASQVRDLRNRIVQFDVRLLRCKQALVGAQAKTIPQIRTSQEAMAIEIQGLEDGILFEIPKLKTLVVQFVAYLATKDAQDGRRKMDEISEKLDNLGDETHEDLVLVAKKSQGDALARAERLNKSIQNIENLIRKTEEMEKENSEKRKKAAELLIEARDRMMDTINNVNMEAAEQAAS